MGDAGGLVLVLLGLVLHVVLVAVAVRWGVLLAVESALRPGSGTRKQIVDLLREGRLGGAGPPAGDPSTYL
ncbi:hypothetical protein [Spirilliplanes yamanashiensis]|uniref:Uncharacterized protein n=1 Tax=Spirilliplanes yamanashiensis TaxID=42233 RepID=A0A8J4DLC5_9ACTN|nr:hypothetical protein [Spirilliplanes yamanashiensis]MDP9816714.1 hypothetical protein [Spirilliplanes yamanashiensis]GIJ06237.1 hypothetical protein Sya03_55890 [Spirilliplanes yamanashiensis]